MRSGKNISLAKMKDYVSFKFPTIRDAFETEIITVQTPRSNGPLGATGVGEMTMVSTAPAVTNAILQRLWCQNLQFAGNTG